MKPANKTLPILFFVIAASIAVWLLMPKDANATGKKTDREPYKDVSQLQHQKMEMDQYQKQSQDQNQVATSSSESSSVSGANNEGNSLNVESNYQAGPAEVVLIPNNNTANCQRVYGFGGGNTSGNVVLGVPFRDKTCDLEAAADDAFAQGNLKLGWVFKCKQKNIKRAMGGEQECLAAVGEQNVVNYMKERIDLLEQQKATLMDVRELDKKRCDEKIERCAAAIFGGK